MPKSFIKFRHLSFLTAILFTGLILFSSSNCYSQGRDRSKFRIVGDTSGIVSDTTKFIDTNYVYVPLDSTARLKYFTYQNKDYITPQYNKYKHPLLLGNSSNIQYSIQFDSLNNVTITQKFQNEDIKIPVTIPFDVYIQKRSKATTKSLFYKLVAEFYKISTDDELERIFKNITDITIPLPFTSETIFGPPTINLKINGLIDITGSYQRTSTDQATILTESQSQNNINFKQEVQVTTKGSVGDKLTIDADWNSQRTFEFENQLKLKYKGYPDEVIQSIEAGNVSLETKSNLIGSTQALFGVKGLFKLGPLSLTAIASQKKSEKKEVNVTGGTTETPFDIAIYDYSENHYFVDLAYDTSGFYEQFYSKGIVPDSMIINEIEVWAQTTPSNPNKHFAVGSITLPKREGAYTDTLYTNQGEIDGSRMSGYFYKLDATEYTYHRQAGYITLNVTNSAADDAVFVAYKLGTGSNVRQYGDFLSDAGANTLILKIARYKRLQAPNTRPAHALAWQLKLKNIYSVGVRNIKDDASKFQLDIVKKSSGAEALKVYPPTGKSYLYLTKLDIKQNGNPTDTVPGGDGFFDFFKGTTIDLVNGEIIFPTLRPFSKTLISRGVSPDSVKPNDTIYTASKYDAQNVQPAIKFSLVGKATGESSSRYSLGFNVVEGSVKVFNGPVELVAGVDYTVDYTSGELVIRNATALVAGSNLKISYETNDLFQLASKTLLGTRAELTLSKTSYIGFTLLNLKQQTLNDKIRIGEEPTNNTIIGFDASTDIKTNFITKLLNKIPGYSTKEESVLNLKGEIAWMLPDPNTKKSKIPSDNNEAVAYIDDFEGSKKTIPLGINPLSWIVSSIPVDSQLVPIAANTTIRDSLMSLKRSTMLWYNLINDVPIKEVFPNRNIANNQNQSLTPMVIDVKPQQVGMFNYITQQTFTNNGPKEKNWSGFFKYLNSSTTNLLNENVNFIEIWMKTDAKGVPGDSAKMMIDLGTISEKIITSSLFPPRKDKDSTLTYHTEDLNRNGVLDVGEDIGLDGWPNDSERTIVARHGLDLGDDPSRDKFAWTQNSTDYTLFNGTEGNSNLSEGKRIDTEDLNGNGNLDILNTYAEYEIALDTHYTSNKFIIGGGNNGWYQYSIPLDQFKKLVGTDNLTNVLTSVQYARVWFKGFSSDSSRMKIVEFNLVGNQWIKSDKNDTTFNISVVNIEDNSNIYQSPVPGDVLRQRDQTQVDQNVLLNEQSLSLEFRNLLPGKEKLAFKTFNTRPVDLINYKILKLFVNGDSSFKFNDTSNYDAAMVIRIGSDTANYYEYRAPIHPDRRPFTPWNALNEVTINLADLTALKQERDSVGIFISKPVPNGPPGSKYGLKGNPTITSVSQIVLGVVNNKVNPIFADSLTGSVWFNELRVLKANDAGGYAFTVNATLKMADFANLNFSYSKVDPNFHSLENRFGTNIINNNWEFSGTVNLHRVINSLLSNYVSLKLKDFITLPVTFSHSEVYDKPQFLPNTDVDLETAVQNKINTVYNQTHDMNLANYLGNQVRIASQTLRVSNRFSVNGMKFNYPSDNFFIQEILNKLEISFYRNSVSERNPTTKSKYAWDMGGSVGLNSNFRLLDKLHLNIGKLLPFGDEYKEAKLYFFFPFLPLAPLFTNNLTLGATFTRSHGDELLRTQLTQSPTTRNFNANRNFTMDWKFIENWIVDITGNYSFGAASDLTFLETTGDSARIQRPESAILNDIFFNKGLINFGKDQTYSQTVNINPKFNIPGLKKFLDLTASYRVQYGWQTSPTNISLGSNVGYNTDLQGSAFLKLNEIFNLFKGKPDKIQGGAYKLQQDDGKQSLGDLFKLLGSFIPSQVNVNYSQTKTLTNPAVSGRPGFGNFWMVFNTKENYGPSRLYQLGWVTDPGKRVANVTLQDRSNLTNIITLSTFINPIFPDNLKISFTYKVTKGNDKGLTYITNNLGMLGLPISVLENKSISRPSFFISSDIISDLAKPDDALANDIKAKLISESFEKKIVKFPFPSWNLTLNGVEKFEMFSGFASSISIESGYTSEYKKTLKYDGTLPEFIQTQGLTTGFSPLLGLNVTFKPIEGGNLTASLKINKTNNFDLDPFSQTVNNVGTGDVSINASYSKTGFTIPLFGLSLKNDLTIGFSYTRTTNDPRLIKFQNGIWNSSAQNGSIATSLNPSIQYALSRSVTLQLFYKYSKTAPTEGNNSIPTRTSNEAGLNIKLSIQ